MVRWRSALARLSRQPRASSVATARLARPPRHLCERDPRRAEVWRAVVVSWDDQHRRWLEALCERTGTVRLLGHVTDAEVALLDLDTAPDDPARVVAELRGARPELRLVVCADDVGSLERVFDAGADAWVSLRAEPDALLAAVTGSIPSAGRRT